MYLLNTNTGEVFCYNERLAKKRGFVVKETLDEPAEKQPVSIAAAETPEAATAYALAAAAKKAGGRNAKK